MVVQIVSYTATCDGPDIASNVLMKMQALYLKHGCLHHEIYRDEKDARHIVEISYFRDREALSQFENTDSTEKADIFNAFCRTLSLRAEDVTVLTLTSQDS